MYNLWIANDAEPIGVTENHPFWSLDREAWTPARDLQVGERLQIAGGLTVVMGFERAGEEKTYNLEVDADHCYRVGESGVLVHNISIGDCKRDPTKASNPCELPKTAFCQAHHVIPCELWDDDVATMIQCCGFDLNGSENLIMLPCCEFEGRTASHHRGRTPKQNYLDKIREFFNSIRQETDPAKICKKTRAFVKGLTGSLCTKKDQLNDESNIKNCAPKPPDGCTVECS